MYICLFVGEPIKGLEPLTYALRMRCAASCAISAYKSVDGLFFDRNKPDNHEVIQVYRMIDVVVLLFVVCPSVPDA